ncbi:MAG: hypothetical protein M1840_000704 [Geoglossum simile]|nr:MAG: hypothetical protein M1840_000704 [Geoglossum simile]
MGNIPDHGHGWQGVKNWGRRVFNKSDVGTAPPDSSAATPSTLGLPVTSAECFQTQAAVQAEQDLWKRACINLRDDPKTEKLMLAYDKILRSIPMDGDPIDIKDLRGPKEEMSAVVDKKLKFFATQQWRIRIGKETVVIRDQIERIVSVVKVVKDFGSSIAGLDPIHAGLPWAGVCVLLTVISTDSDQHAAVINGLEYITRVIPHYSAFETNIQKEGYPLEDVNAVQDQLIYLYSLTLKYQANAICFFGRNTFKRFLRNIVPTTSWPEALQEIKAAAAECEQSLNTRNLQHLKETLEQQKRDVEKLLHKLRQNYSQRDQVLKWVSDVPNWEDHESVRAKLGEHYWGSGQWLFESSEFLKWEKTGSRVFWLRGAVGTGKSCLTSLVIQRHLVGDCPERQAYFYCSGASQRSALSNPTDVLRSLVAQLSYTLFEPANKEWETKDRGRGTLTLADCKRLLIELTRSTGTYTIIIDALDECSDPSELVEFLNFTAESSKGLQIFFSSRLEDHITPKFTSVSSIEINQKRNQGDITAFVEGECRRRREVIRSRCPREPEQMTDDLAKKLQILLKDRAGDMFRWVELQLNLVLVIQRPLHRTKIEERLKRLETSTAVPDLNKTYDDVYDMNTEGGYGELAAKAFKWVLCSFEPLHIDVLVSAVAIFADGRWDETFTKDSMLNRFCSNFIITDDSGIVRFAHLSVREYLEQHRSGLYSPLQSHTQAAVSCLSLMLQPVPDSSAMTAAKRPPWREFREYANLYWPYHCEKARESRKVGDLQKLFSSFVLIPQPPYLRWLEILPKLLDLERYGFPADRLRVVSNPPDAFFLACTFGFEDVGEFATAEGRLST